MQRYMVVIYDGQGTAAIFTDDLDKAEDYRMNSECGMGWHAEVYERTEIEEGLTAYQFMYS